MTAALIDLTAEAVFASHLQRSQHPTTADVSDAVNTTVLRLGTCGIAAAVAHEYGEHPDLAVCRMRWARVMARRAIAAQPARHPAVTR